MWQALSGIIGRKARAGGLLVYFILYALSELTVANPDSGSFRTFASQAFGEGTGFVVGWVYWTGMILAMSSEATAVSIMARGFFPKLPTSLAGGVIILAVTLINLVVKPLYVESTWLETAWEDRKLLIREVPDEVTNLAWHF
ncbi:amino acid permease [bacterium BFN5]|nr:amino acid permease [bacterium BFN5]